MVQPPLVLFGQSGAAARAGRRQLKRLDKHIARIQDDLLGPERDQLAGLLTTVLRHHTRTRDHSGTLRAGTTVTRCAVYRTLARVVTLDR